MPRPHLLPINGLCNRLIAGCVGHASVHSDTVCGSRAWGSGGCARCVEQQQQQRCVEQQQQQQQRRAWGSGECAPLGVRVVLNSSSSVTSLDDRTRTTRRSAAMTSYIALRIEVEGARHGAQEILLRMRTYGCARQAHGQAQGSDRSEDGTRGPPSGWI